MLLKKYENGELNKITQNILRKKSKHFSELVTGEIPVEEICCAAATLDIVAAASEREESGDDREFPGSTATVRATIVAEEVHDE